MTPLEKFQLQFVDGVQALVDGFIADAAPHIGEREAGDIAASSLAGMVGAWCARPWRGTWESSLQLQQRKACMYAGFRVGLTGD